jgi:hypothetical protein
MCYLLILTHLSLLACWKILRDFYFSLLAFSPWQQFCKFTRQATGTEAGGLFLRCLEVVTTLPRNQGGEVPSGGAKVNLFSPSYYQDMQFSTTQTFFQDS